MTTFAPDQITEGQLIDTVGRYHSKTATVPGVAAFPVFIGKTYRATKDARGNLVWRLVGYFGPDRSARHRPTLRHIMELRALAKNPWKDSGVTQHQRCNPAR